MSSGHISRFFLFPPFEEWWKGHIRLPLGVRPSISVQDGDSDLHLSF